MRILTDCIRAEREFGVLLSALAELYEAKRPLPLLVNGLSGGALTAALTETVRDAAAAGHPALLLVPDDPTARHLCRVMTAAGLRAPVYPARDLVFHEITASHGTERERLFVLHAILAGRVDAVIATPGAALQYTMPRARLSSLSVTLEVGQEYPPATLATLLESLGYAHVEVVEGAGQYARRGGIFDIFSAEASAPVRMEFFGDEIDRMGFFDPLTQRLFEPCPSLTLLPAREVTVDTEARERVAEAILTMQKKASPSAYLSLAAELAAVQGGTELTFADKYISLIYPERENLLSYLEEGARKTVILLGTSAVYDSMKATLSLSAESVVAEEEAGVMLSSFAHYFAPAAALDEALATHAPLHFNSFSGGVGTMQSAGLFGFRCRTGVSYADKPDLLREDLTTLLASGYRTLVLTSSRAEEEALSARLREAGLAALPLPKGHSPLDAEYAPGVVYTTVADPAWTDGGFELPTSRVALLSLLPSGPRRQARRTKRRAPAGEKLLSYADLREGDYVVHAVHGIGIFDGMTTMTVDGATRDYITLRYAGTDKLFLPADRLEMISKYIGSSGEDGRFKLSRLGGGEWQRTKTRAKAAARSMAKELIALYAARLRRPGHAFAPDDEMQREFESGFPFEETEAQLLACEEIKRDMERPVPMDRLLCGDVGYGKTEVALRAAFKAVADGKQVAILVPTTILAMQHYETALSRMRGFPVTVEMLSRFRTPKQVERILRRLARGEIDILIGTHKLLSSRMVFRDLGLLIVDEEQRFGVAQKEKLKALAGNVDVLTLTATPIPRTLNMAMSGIRDMSLLDEAPGDRLPVQTYVLEHDELTVTEAIRRELRRRGQVIYLYNRVETMERTAARLMRALPDARIVTAHGRMDREELEEIWQALVRGEIDLILCTTIVETGVDLPNANTLIIEDADRLGLSQLHQLRGRVGRSERQAYAYFTYRAGKALSEVAAKRLSAIREYAAFGAGFKIALRDLEIRGAGNLLGAEQHGNIEAVGYELYVRLLHEAVLEEQGKSLPSLPEAQIEIRADAHIPESYLPSAAGRMEMYKKISAILSAEDARDVEEELCDRFGRPPRPVLRLLSVALARALASRANIARVEERGGELAFVLRQVDLSTWSVLFAEQKGLKFTKSTPPCVLYRLSAGEDAATAAARLLTRFLAVAEEEAREPQNQTSAEGGTL